MSLINGICRKIFTYFSSPYIFYKFLQGVTRKFITQDVFICRGSLNARMTRDYKKKKKIKVKYIGKILETTQR